MKNIQSIFLAAVVFTALFSVTGCLKDKGYNNGSIQSVHNLGADIKPIEIKLTATNSTNFLIAAIDNSTNDTTIDLVPINLATANTAEQDIHVTVELDSSLVSAYNDANGRADSIPPDSIYSIINPVVTIAKGSNTGYLQIKFKPSDLIGKSYTLGFRIASVQESGYTISGNLNTGIVALLIKNKYDGTYTVTGESVDFINPAFSSSVGGVYPFDIELQTTSATSVVMFIPGTGYYHLIPGNSVYGEFAPVFNFDPITDAITSVANYYGDPSPTRGRSAQIDVTGINKFNADHSIDVSYIMYQAGALRTTFTEHFEYNGPR
jgi:hypothetical protein